MLGSQRRGLLLIRSNTRKQVTLLTRFGWAGISTPVINSAHYFLSIGWRVVVLALDSDDAAFPFPHWPFESIRLVRVDTRQRLANGVRYRSLAAIVCRSAWASEWVIAFDTKALLTASASAQFWRRRVLYYSLEFFEPAPGSWRSKLVKLLERACVKACSGVVSQDDARCRYLQQDLRSARVVAVPNSPRGPVIAKQSILLRQQLNIQLKRRVVLCVGTLDYCTYVDMMLRSAVTWDERFLLVLHGWFPDRDLRLAALDAASRYPHKILVSSERLDDSEKQQIYLCADIVFVGFVPKTNNLRLAAGSAGKLYDALQCGRPVLARDSPGMRELIEGRSVGRVFSNPGEISRMLAFIDKHYERMRRNCFMAHEAFEYDKRFEAALLKCGIDVV